MRKYWVITIFIFCNNVLYCQKHPYDFGSKIIEQIERRHEEARIREMEKRIEENAIADVIRDIHIFEEDVIELLTSLDKFKNDIISSRIKKIIFMFRATNHSHIYDTSEDYYSISKTRDEIYREAKELLRSKEIIFLSEMLKEKNKLDTFLESRPLSSRQIAAIKKGYDSFLENPFREDSTGEYIGFSFSINSALAKLPSTGTAFAITKNGYLITNYHVIENAESIIIKQINNNEEKRYNAKLVISDISNDLAILKIEDANFKSLNDIPFIIDSRIADVGSNIFVLGYPLVGTMGQDLKLTNGIISAKSGFKGDISLYQISAPVQPGNSGGPLFDEKGNLIGIVCSKYIGAENVSYAVKSMYLLNLIGTMEKPIKLNLKNSLNGKRITEKFKVLSNSIFLVETN